MSHNNSAPPVATEQIQQQLQSVLSTLQQQGIKGHDDIDTAKYEHILHPNNHLNDHLEEQKE